MRLCIDCKYNDGVCCYAPQSYTRTSLVTGKPEQEWFGCEANRLHGGCGMDAKWFQPKSKKPWWRFW